MTELTKTENIVVQLMMSGYQRKEIADRLNTSPNTVSVHFRNIHKKTAVQNEIELYNWYSENVLRVNIRKMLQVSVLLLILSPSIIAHDNNILRVRRSPATKTARASRRADSETDFYLFN